MVIEAPNKAGELFGFERTHDAIAEACQKNLEGEGIIDHLFASVASHVANAEQDDDQTIVILSRNEG